MADLLTPLSDDQMSLLQVVCKPFLDEDQWPVWDYVDRTLSLQRLDARQVLESFPFAHTTGGHYAAIWCEATKADSSVRLRIAAAVHLREYRQRVGEPFIQVLNSMIDIFKATPISATKVASVRISSDDVIEAFPAVDQVLLEHMPEFFRMEPPFKGPPAWIEDRSRPSTWVGEFDSTLIKYHGLASVQDYVERVAEIGQLDPWASIWANGRTKLSGDRLRTSGGTDEAGRAIQNTQVSASTRSIPASYISVSLIDELVNAQARTTWHLGKLIKILNELNDAHRMGSQYACHGLVRTLLNHLPPIFGQSKFGQFVANYPAQTDKKYLRDLEVFRASADDALHRPIRKSADMIDMDDLPAKAAVNALLRIVIDTLNGESESNTTGPLL